MREPDSFSAQVVVAVVVTLLLVGGAGVAGLLLYNSAARTREEAIRTHLDDVLAAERLRGDVERALASGRGFLLAGDPLSLERVREAEADIDRGIRDLQRRVRSPEGERMLGRLASETVEYRRALERLLQAKAEDLDLETLGQRFSEELLPMRQGLDTAFDAFLSLEKRSLAAQLESLQRSEQRTLSVALGIVLLGVVGGGFAFWWTSHRFRGMYRREQEALQTAKRAVGARQQLLATVAHDLRSPLSAITLKAGLVRKSGDLEQARQRAAGIETLSARMEHLIASLLDAASLEAGSFSVSARPCDAAALLRETLELFGTLAAQKSIRLASAVSAGAQLAVLADRERTLQVLSNLVGNALKFTPEGGEIVLSAERDGERVRFAIADCGPGISAENLPHLFERFWTTEAGSKSGTGLGLFIARGIVESHGGRIWVESSLGRGSTFYFTLPVSTAPGPRPEPSRPAFPQKALA